MIKVTMIPTDHVALWWDRVKPLLEKAAEYTYGRYDVDDILDSITDYGYTLWVAFDEDGIKGVVVTNFVVYPRKKFVNLAFCGGSEGLEWKDPMLKLLQHWAHDNQCDGLEATARLGWAKIFKSDGYEPLFQTFQLPAADAGLGA